MKETLDTLFIKYIKASAKDEDFVNRVKEITEKLWKSLNHEERVLFNDYADAYNEYLWTSSADYFRQGFWVGCEMTREFKELN